MLIILFLGFNVFVWHKSRNILPQLEITENVPSEISIKSFSLGDEQFYYRILAWQLQFMGDSFGRVSPLKYYDYVKIKNWFYLLDKLDNKTNYSPVIATYYYGVTPKKEDLIHIIEYLEKHSEVDLTKKWWWMYQASYLAFHEMKYHSKGIELAKKVAQTKGTLPLWARQLPAFYHEKIGEKDIAYFIIKDILDNEKNIPQSELNFMEYYIKDRLKLFE
ncbi:MAG: hypothetical protein J0H68_05585 [Sphingobacteriia bacterium]|nr:hypothetical protein [Sphingobacteriia bacterium]